MHGTDVAEGVRVAVGDTGKRCSYSFGIDAGLIAHLCANPSVSGSPKQHFVSYRGRVLEARGRRPVVLEHQPDA